MRRKRLQDALIISTLVVGLVLGYDIYATWQTPTRSLPELLSAYYLLKLAFIFGVMWVAGYYIFRLR